MIELNTPLEIIEKIGKAIENERKHQRIKQKDLASKADVAFATYKKFLYKQKISLESLIKILIALKMFDNLNGLAKQSELKSLKDIREKLPKRIYN